MRARIRAASAALAAAVGVLLIAPGCGLQLSGLDTGATDAGLRDATGHRMPTPDATQGTDSSSSGAQSDDGSDSPSGDATGDDGDDGDATDATSVDGAPQAEASDDGGAAGDGGLETDAGASDDAESSDDGGDAGEDSSTTPPGTDAGQGKDAAAPDASGTNDAGNDAGGATEAGSGDTCAGVSGCVIVPTGWTLVAFAPSQTAACPSGFGDLSNLVEGPSASNSCGCGACSTTTAPTCNAGTIGVAYDDALSVDIGTCLDPGTPPTLANSPPESCGTDLYQGSYETYDVLYTAPGASGGVCSATPTTGSLAFAAHDRSCTPGSAGAANCAGQACTPALSASYEACITPASAGVAACPAGPLAVQHLVGTGASFTCSACACTVTATCSEGTITLYNSTDCTHAAASFTTGDCTNVALSTDDATFESYKYRGGTASDITCAATPGTAQNIALTNETTICCAN